MGGAGVVVGSSQSWGRSSLWAWCSFLIVIGACHHPLTLPNLQAGACSGGSGWRVLSGWFASSSPVISFCRCSIVGPLSPCSFLPSRCFELHPFPHREPLLAPVVLGAEVVVVPASLWPGACSFGGPGPSWVPALFLIGVGPGAHSFLSLVPAIIHSPYPACKQVLAVVGMGGGSVLSWDSAVLGG